MQDSVETAVVARKEIARLLRDAADNIESGQKVPTAVYVQVFWSDQSMTKSRHVRAGFSLLNALAIFRLIQDDLSEEIRGKD